VSQRIDFVRSSLPSSEQLILETVEETIHGVVLRVRAKHLPLSRKQLIEGYGNDFRENGPFETWQTIFSKCVFQTTLVFNGLAFFVPANILIY
jgi:hypothetical protein